MSPSPSRTTRKPRASLTASRSAGMRSPHVEQDYVNRLATARLVRPRVGTSSAFIDLLFANSGIEDEIVRRADRLEVLPDVFMPVASTGHLIALKVLAGRPVMPVRPALRIENAAAACVGTMTATRREG
jgi:hypothetical protein